MDHFSSTLEKIRVVIDGSIGALGVRRSPCISENYGEKMVDCSWYELTVG